MCVKKFLFYVDINELNLPKTCGTEFPDPDDLLSFKLIICPDEVRTFFFLYIQLGNDLKIF